jgi:Ca-activated chloride channel family protein
MNSLFEHPLYLFFIFLLLPVLVFFLTKVKKLQIGKSFGIYSRTICWSVAFISAIIALAGPSWGTASIPVQKSGSSACFVFDISNSMLATDIPGDLAPNRLEAMKKISAALVEEIPATSIGVVLNKGNGVLAIPLTEDHYSVQNLIDSLSVHLLSAPGSSLGQGIETAIHAFPSQSARKAHIILFTDGDETDNSLARVCKEASSYGIKITIIGFGTEKGCEIVAGDGKTKVTTVQQKKYLEKIAQDVDGLYVDALTVGSMSRVLKTIETDKQDLINTGYELKSVPRQNLFLIISISFFLLGFIYSELKVFTRLSCLFLCFICMGCTEDFESGASIFKGTFQWYRQDYEKATAQFLQATELAKQENNTLILQYGLYGLGATYLMQNETDAAMSKLQEIAPDAPKEIQFASWYNGGIIAHRQGNYEQAAQCFKKALIIDSTNLEAKINLEICLQSQNVSANQGEQEMIPVNETSGDSALGDAIFSVLKEKEQQRWKNQVSEPEENGVLDY